MIFLFVTFKVLGIALASVRSESQTWMDERHWKEESRIIGDEDTLLSAKGDSNREIIIINQNNNTNNDIELVLGDKNE